MPPRGTTIVGAVELGPDGTTLEEPVTVTIPLIAALPPRSTAPLRLIDPTGALVDEGITAVVDDDGTRVRAMVRHFSTVAVTSPARTTTTTTTPPAITAIEPASGEEGDAVPVLLTDVGFSGDLMPVVLDHSGRPTADVFARSCVTDGRGRAGVLLDIRTSRASTAGASRSAARSGRAETRMPRCRFLPRPCSPRTRSFCATSPQSAMSRP